MLRLRTHNQNRTMAASAIADRKNLRTSVVTGGDTSPIFQATKHNLNPVASFVSLLVVFDCFAP